jgi:hypothetical protein
MLDPDLRIQGNGWKRLDDAGIATQFFPKPLIDEIAELNRDFIRDREARRSQKSDARKSNEGTPSRLDPHVFDAAYSDPELHDFVRMLYSSETLLEFGRYKYPCAIATSHTDQESNPDSILEPELIDLRAEGPSIEFQE